MRGEKDTIYDAQKLAKFFGVSLKTVYKWCGEGKLPAFKIGKEWKVRLMDIQKMIENKVRARESEGKDLFSRK